MDIGSRQRWWEVALYRFVRVLILGVAKAFGRIEVIGRENIPRTGPFVLAPVHRSNIDFALASLVTTRRMRYMGKDAMWKYRFTAWFFNSAGGFPVHRGTADREALRTCMEVIAGGEAEIGMQQIIENQPVEGAHLVGPLPPELQDYVVFSAGVLAVSKQPEAATAMVKFMSAPEAAPLIRKSGMEPAVR